jgi:hypothetical protein
MLARVPTKMRSTTNTLEYFNGYFNTIIPRFNSFWGSLDRLVDLVMGKTERFSACLRHNSAHESREVVERYRSAGSSRMQKELTFSQTVLGECTCWETNHLSTISAIGIPCRHQLAFIQQEECPGFPIRALSCFRWFSESFPEPRTAEPRVAAEWGRCELVTAKQQVVSRPERSGKSRSELVRRAAMWK